MSYFERFTVKKSSFIVTNNDVFKVKIYARVKFVIHAQYTPSFNI